MLALTAMQMVGMKAMAQEAYAVLIGQTVTFYYDTQKESRGGIEINNLNLLFLYSNYSPYRNAAIAVIDASFAEYRPTSTAYWFQGCSYLTTINGMENIKTDNVTDMQSMFSGCYSLTSLDVSSFNTSNVKDMGSMFYCCSSLTSLDVSGFNTSNVKNMRSMFCGCTILTSLDVSSFNTSNVKDMSYMFRNCHNLTSLDVSSFNTSNVTYMSYMFRNCINLTSLDVSGFNTSNVTDMSLMFFGCSMLKTIYVGEGWSTEKVTSGNDMFYDCRKLVGGNGTKYNLYYTNYTYARIDGGTDAPGYFTYKETSGINDIKADIRENAPVYNLRGQRLAAPRKGINIVGGKKVVVK